MRARAVHAVLRTLTDAWPGLPRRRWRTYLRPDVKHPHLEPFTEWEAAVIVQAQRDMGNNWLGALACCSSAAACCSGAAVVCTQQGQLWC